MIEIERKYLVKNIPKLDGIEYVDIKQGYLNCNSEPILRIRKYEKKYYLTYKFKKKGIKTNACIEYELPITKYAFDHLLKKIDNNLISKKRFKISIENNLTAELDLFSNQLAGLVMVEVEFETEEEAISFNPPKWFGREITKDKRYRNSELSKIKKFE